MDNEIKIFSNPNFGDIRTAGTSEEPLFCLADICRAVNLTNPSSVKSRLDKDDVQLVDLHALKHSEGTITGNSSANFVTESGLYDVLLYSDAPQIKPFRRWVVKEVLPSIRKTGKYEVGKQKRNMSPTTKMRMGIEWVRAVSDILNLNNSSKLYLLEKVAEPMELPLPKYTDSKGVLFSATELLKRVGAKMSVREFNKKMKEIGFLSERIRKSSRGEKRFNVLNENCSEYGENQVCLHNPKETQPLYYEGRFCELMEKIGVVIG